MHSSGSVRLPVCWSSQGPGRAGVEQPTLQLQHVGYHSESNEIGKHACGAAADCRSTPHILVLAEQVQWYYPSIGASIISGQTLPTTRSITIASAEQEGTRHAPIGHDLVYVVGSRARRWCVEKHYYIAVLFAEEWYRYKRVYRWYVAFTAESRQL